MGRIALLVPREEMLHQAHNILQEKRYSIGEMRVIQSESTVAEARKSIAGGASIIIARGLQASLIKRYTDIPVIEIVLTAQEMALLVMRARQIVKKQLPVIAVVGFRNMFCDMSYFDELYDVSIEKEGDWIFVYTVRDNFEVGDAHYLYQNILSDLKNNRIYNYYNLSGVDTVIYGNEKTKDLLHFKE